MEVTRHNFHEQLESILESIENCDFMAIDGEFTGLSATNAGHAAPFDTPEDRYDKLRWESTDFLLVQFGLCTFQVNTETKSYRACPYNFYVFPRPHSRGAPDRRFLCQSSSIDFLVSNGFDFNKLFREGIPYLMPDAEKELSASLVQKHEDATKLLSPGFSSPYVKKGGHMTVPEEQKPFLNGIIDKISNYLDTEETEPLPLPACNSFQRRLIYQNVEEKFPNVQLETVTGDNKERYMLVSRTKNPEERLKKEKDKQALEKLELDIQVGFSKVMRAISESGKLVVGHNMMLDIIHSVNQFHCPLPEDLNGFKAVVKTVFPRLLDTKLMASTVPFKEHFLATSLDEVRLTLLQPPFSKVNIECPEGFERYQEGGGGLHEAGYDAFITGSCFAHMTKFLGSFQRPVDEFLVPTSPVVEPFVNKIFLMRINDIPYLNLNGPDLPPQRDHIFHVTFPREWKPTDLYQLFQPYGTIQISWLNETSAYVGLHKKENAGKALKALSKEQRAYHVVSYANHQRSKSSYKWSSPAADALKAELKRKQSDDTSSDCTPSKLNRNSNCNVPPVPSPLAPVTDTETCSTQDTQVTTVHSSQTCPPESRTTDGSAEEKLFEESDNW